jgi:SAM-dependent methyltransferase
MLARGDDAQHDLYGRRKQALFMPIEGRDGRPPVVVEIGAGTGLNARYLPAGATWVVVEPNVYFHDRVRAEAAAHGLVADVRPGTSERLPVADGEADAVVSTLVLCSVGDVSRSLAEARRALRPGGRFVFIEHVAAPDDTALRRAQRLLRRPWGWVADGCRPDQETAPLIEAAGFAEVRIDRFGTGLGLVGPHIAGVAIR